MRRPRARLAVRRPGPTRARRPQPARRQVLEPRGEAGAEDLRRRARAVPRRRRARRRRGAARDPRGELGTRLRPRQRVALHHLERAAQLGLGALQELAPRRHVEEERAHLDRGAARGAPPARRRARGRPRCAPATRRRRARRVEQLDPRHRGDRGQRLAAKPERRRPAPGPRRSGSCRWRGGRRRAATSSRPMPEPSSSTAIRALAAGLELDRDAARAGVERVLDQLLDHRGRALDHLAGGDLAHQPVVEESDLRHRYSTVGSATSRASSNSRASSRSRRCVACITW